MPQASGYGARYPTSFTYQGRGLVLQRVGMIGDLDGSLRPSPTRGIKACVSCVLLRAPTLQRSWGE